MRSRYARAAARQILLASRAPAVEHCHPSNHFVARHHVASTVAVRSLGNSVCTSPAASYPVQIARERSSVPSTVEALLRRDVSGRSRERRSGTTIGIETIRIVSDVQVVAPVLVAEARALASRAARRTPSESGPLPTRVVYALTTPNAASMDLGEIPRSVAAPPRRRVARRHERIGTMVDVEQRPLSTLQQDRRTARPSTGGLAKPTSSANASRRGANLRRMGRAFDSTSARFALP